MNIIKAVGIINFSPEQVCGFIMDSSYKWDDMLEESRVLYDLGEDILVMYERFKFPWPVSNRDFVYGLKVLRRDDGFFIVTKSIDVPGPEVRATVRGEIVLSGFMLKKMESGKTE